MSSPIRVLLVVQVCIGIVVVGIMRTSVKKCCSSGDFALLIHLYSETEIRERTPAHLMSKKVIVHYIIIVNNTYTALGLL